MSSQMMMLLWRQSWGNDVFRDDELDGGVEFFSLSAGLTPGAYGLQEIAHRSIHKHRWESDSNLRLGGLQHNVLATLPSKSPK